MVETFRTPDFIDPNIKPGHLKNEKYGEGIATIVANLEGLPTEIKEKIPDGFVVKKYLFAEFDSSWEDLFGNDPEIDPFNNDVLGEDIKITIEELADRGINSPTTDEIFRELDTNPDLTIHGEKLKRMIEANSLLGIAKKLKAREDILRDYFADTLPELIVPSHFIIGTETDENDKKQKRLFNFQKKITNVADLNEVTHQRLNRAVRNKKYDNAATFLQEETAKQEIKECASIFAAEIKAKLPNCQTIKEQITKLTKKAENIVNQTKLVQFDLFAPQNLIITEEGLRIIDTNQAVPYNEKHNQFQLDPKSFEKILQHYVEFWREVEKEL